MHLHLTYNSVSVRNAQNDIHTLPRYGAYIAISASTTFYFSTNGGQTWSNKTIPAASYGVATGSRVAGAPAANTRNINISTNGGNNFSSTANVFVNARDWRKIAYGERNNLRAMVTLCHNSNIGAYSNNGLRGFNEVTLPFSANWNRIAFGGGTFIAVANASADAIISTDLGLTWSNVSLNSTRDWYGISYSNRGGANGTWFAVGHSGANTTTIVTSTDNGNTWSNVTVPGGQWGLIATNNNNTWVCLQTVGSNVHMYSTDNGSTWNTGALVANITPAAMVYGNRFVVIRTGAGTPIFSDNGTTWTQSFTSLLAAAYQDLAYV